MASRVAKPAALSIGILLLILGLLGYMDTPLVGRHGAISADSGMSFYHAILGAFLVLMSFGGESVCAFGLYATCGICLLSGGYALYSIGSYEGVKLFDLTVATRSVAYFQIVLGITAAIFGKMNTARQQLFRE